jgi:hypothetical protein
VACESPVLKTRSTIQTTGGTGHWNFAFPWPVLYGREVRTDGLGVLGPFRRSVIQLPENCIVEPPANPSWAVAGSTLVSRSKDAGELGMIKEVGVEKVPQQNVFPSASMPSAVSSLDSTKW